MCFYLYIAQEEEELTNDKRSKGDAPQRPQGVCTEKMDV